MYWWSGCFGQRFWRGERSVTSAPKVNKTETEKGNYEAEESERKNKDHIHNGNRRCSYVFILADRYVSCTWPKSYQNEKSKFLLEKNLCKRTSQHPSFPLGKSQPQIKMSILPILQIEAPSSKVCQQSNILASSGPEIATPNYSANAKLPQWKRQFSHLGQSNYRSLHRPP
jgi:hypothetical protein